MTNRYPYAMRNFTGLDAMTAATEVLLTHTDAVECGDQDGKVTIYRAGDRPDRDPHAYWWMTFSADGRECAGRGEDDLIVYQPGPWDTALDRIPQERDWWSWLQVIRQTSMAGGPDQTSKALEGVLRRYWIPTRLIAKLAPLNIDDVVVALVDEAGARPFSRSGGCLMVKRTLPPSTSAAGLHQWWVDLFDAVAAKYRLASDGMVPYIDGDEGFLRLIGLDGSLPEDGTMDALVEAMDTLGATTDDWYEDGPAMNLPISGSDLAGLVRQAAAKARDLGLSVVEIHPDVGPDLYG